MTKQFNPLELLSELSSSHSSGYLDINGGSASWQIHLKEGNLKYIECSVQSLAQLKYYLERQGWNAAFAALKEKSQFYPNAEVTSSTNQSKPGLFEDNITWLQSEGYLDATQTVQLIEDITQDAFESLLCLKEGNSLWFNSQKNTSWIEKVIGTKTNFDLPDLIKFVQQRLKKWQNCAKELWSPHQRPYLLDYRQISKPIPSGTLSTATLSKLAQIMQGLSIRQIALVLKQDELHVAQLLSPYIQHGIIYLRNPQPPFDRLPKIPRQLENSGKEESNSIEIVQKAVKTYKIACIDDSPTILNEIQRFLGKERFEITTIDDPIQATSVIFRIKPDLILLDITMPKINGYKICSLLRNSAAFDETPIIMVTGNTGLIDKARAKMSGSTDYLTKPFTQKALIAVVEKYLEPIASNN